ncbi:MAG: hypothetical protein WAL32_08895 [Terriglobales bacterium]
MACNSGLFDRDDEYDSQPGKVTEYGQRIRQVFGGQQTTTGELRIFHMFGERDHFRAPA